MVTSLFKYDKIQTTDAKAKELRILADRMVTLAKRGDLHARRQALAIIREKDVVHKLFDEAKERFGSTAGGYTRIVKIGHRSGDAAPVSLIELITPEGGKKKKPAKKKSQPKARVEKSVDAKTPVSEKTAQPEKAEASVESHPAEEKTAEPDAKEEEVAADRAEDVPDVSGVEEETGDAPATPETAEEKEKDSPAK